MIINSQKKLSMWVSVTKYHYKTIVWLVNLGEIQIMYYSFRLKLLTSTSTKKFNCVMDRLTFSPWTHKHCSGDILEVTENLDENLSLTILVRAECVRCPRALLRNEVSTIFGIIFLLFFLSVAHTFLPEGVILGLWNFALGFKSHKK